ARQRAERTAAMLTSLASVTLHINAAETFDGVAAAAAAGAAQIFSVPAVLILEMPDGQSRRMSGAPGSRETVRRGGPAGLPSRIADRVLGPREASAVAVVRREDWLRIVPDSTLRVDVCIGVARTKPGKLPVAIVIGSAGISGEEDRSLLRQLAQSIALGVQ